jgi:hypothetical protein
LPVSIICQAGSILSAEASRGEIYEKTKREAAMRREKKTTAGITSIT